jgi:IS30 family transposase
MPGMSVATVAATEPARHALMTPECECGAVVCRQLRRGWSPASIAGRLPCDYPEDQACRVSHEAIYQWFTSPVKPDQRIIRDYALACAAAAA